MVDRVVPERAVTRIFSSEAVPRSMDSTKGTDGSPVAEVSTAVVAELEMAPFRVVAGAAPAYCLRVMSFSLGVHGHESDVEDALEEVAGVAPHLRRFDAHVGHVHVVGHGALLIGDPGLGGDQAHEELVLLQRIEVLVGGA